MSRMDIVRSVADMDGGAHLDPALTPLYNLFRSGQLLGWMVMTPEIPEGQYVPSPQYACIRVIAHETFLGQICKLGIYKARPATGRPSCRALAIP